MPDRASHQSWAFVTIQQVARTQPGFEVSNAFPVSEISSNCHWRKPWGRGTSVGTRRPDRKCWNVLEHVFLEERLSMESQQNVTTFRGRSWAISNKSRDKCLQSSDCSNRGDAVYSRVPFPTHVNLAVPLRRLNVFHVGNNRFSLIKNSPTKGDQHARSAALGSQDHTLGHEEGWGLLSPSLDLLTNRC